MTDDRGMANDAMTNDQGMTKAPMGNGRQRLKFVGMSGCVSRLSRALVIGHSLVIASLVIGHWSLVILPPSQVVTPEANAITVTELSGMRIAQTMGDRFPLAAMLMPATL